MLCRDEIGRNSNTQLCVFSYEGDLLPLEKCWISVSSSQPGFIIHRCCWEVVNETLGKEKDATEILRSLRLLADSLRLSWPVEETFRALGMREMAIDALEFFMRFTWISNTESGLWATLKRLHTLPAELQSLIIHLSHPCALTRIWILQKTTMFLAYSRDPVGSPQRLSAPAEMRTMRGKILGREYVVGIKGCPAYQQTRMLVASFDGIGCTSLNFESSRDTRPGIWYRFIPPESQNDILVFYKV